MDLKTSCPSDQTHIAEKLDRKLQPSRCWRIQRTQSQGEHCKCHQEPAQEPGFRPSRQAQEAWAWQSTEKHRRLSWQ
ncbi:hypothetical protein PIB30_114684 [Stylosanthes scabra]|uniref:Uncharacterized protein n=1 Tax=Stylosanthes scabra TaxID=79078 RepID=A0ABU6R1K0_9FABA|nr:hypothetical protein [Stylosanthes scabra]